MKKQLLALAFLACFSAADAQKGLLPLMKGDKGVAKQFTAFSAKDQVAFNPKTAKAILGVDPKSDLVLYSTEKDNLGVTHYRFYQTYGGIRIESTMLIAHVKDGKLVSASAALITDFAPSLAASLSTAAIADKDAVQKAISHVGASSYAWQDTDMENSIKEQTGKADASYFPKATKVWYNAGNDLNPSALQLAYKVDIYAQEPFTSRAYYFVDAASGTILGHKDILQTTDAVGTATTVYSGNQTIHSDQTGVNAFRLRDYTRGNGIITRKAKGQVDFTNTSANWTTLILPDQNGLDAHYGVEMTYDYYKVNFNRNSIDNNGIALYSNVNKKGFLYKDNASWDGNAMNYGIRSGGSQRGVTGIDVTGHELTHGVTQYTCNLVYSGESGGMNESLSDIMGKSVQFWAKPADKDWRLSNDMAWFIRDMSNPNAYSQPDTYGGTFWKSNADVHILSGVGNYMFYLLVDGGSGTNDLGNSFTVTGLGLSKADQIIYRSQTVYLVPTSNYAAWRTAAISAATDLYGAASNEVAQVKNAFYAVGIGTAAFAGNNPTELAQNITMYPNPVNGTTSTVKFALKEAGNITLKVFDRSGNVQQTYALGNRLAGNQSYTLSKTAQLTTGDYYITIEHNGALAGRLKFVVLK
jgi:bacillolysin